MSDPHQPAERVGVLQVTPNGPWGKEAHPQMPVSLNELVSDLEAWFRAGATGVHLHVRDESGHETLEPSVVGQTCSRVVRPQNGWELR
jgi:uncharacterized protein (DUF849 family)